MKWNSGDADREKNTRTCLVFKLFLYEIPNATTSQHAMISPQCLSAVCHAKRFHRQEMVRHTTCTAWRQPRLGMNHNNRVDNTKTNPSKLFKLLLSDINITIANHGRHRLLQTCFVILGNGKLTPAQSITGCVPSKSNPINNSVTQLKLLHIVIDMTFSNTLIRLHTWGCELPPW